MTNLPADERNARYDPMTRDELIAECERLERALTETHDAWTAETTKRLLAEQESVRLERERSEWAGVAATRNRNIALIADERDRAVGKLSQTAEEFEWLLQWSGAKDWHGWWDSRLVESCEEPLRSRMAAHFARLRGADTRPREHE